MNHSRLLGVALALVAAASIATWLVSDSQHSQAAAAAQQLGRAGDSLEAMLTEQLALETFADTRDPLTAGSAIVTAHHSFEAAITALQALSTTPAERQTLADEAAAEQHWQGLSFAIVTGHLPRTTTIDLKPERALVASVRSDEERLSDLQIQAAGRNQDKATAQSLWLLALTLLVLGSVIGASLLRDRTTSRGRRFNELLSASRGEDEAYGLLKRHLERSTRGAEATVLVRNNSANRLEARTSAPSGTIAERLQTAAPDSCLAVRLARPHVRHKGEDELLSCEVCGASRSAALCSPLLVGGEVMGSVLLTRRHRFAHEMTARVAELLTIAAPAIANLRNLAIAQARAATDALTGLPNRRAVDDEVKRTVARAGRTGSTLAAAMLDIDHFKRVNDTFGHDHGDELLAAVADLAASTLRAGDFVGRYGGEEFVILLPDTDRDGAAQAAESLRQTISQLRLPGGLPSVTVSIGVATMPHNGIDSEQLIRAADRALYLAKSRGRNRVEIAANNRDPAESVPAYHDDECPPETSNDTKIPAAAQSGS